MIKFLYCYRTQFFPYVFFFQLKMRQLICHLQTKHLLHKYGQSKSGDTGDNVEDENEDIEQEKGIKRNLISNLDN